MITQSISDPALSLDKDSSGTGYLLNPRHSSVWITIDNISVYLRRHDWGVCIDLYPIGQEDKDSLASTWLTFDEARIEPE